MFERILLPIDSSKNLEAVTKYAISLLKKLEISLMIKAIIPVCVLK
tara:strand:+ start:331 stop:468 length:138 start_codon:yes stop_codon:yes gene_type:complete